MKKTIALLAAAALCAACAKDIDPDDVRAAMPKAAVIQIATPSDTNPNALSAAAPTVGEVSEFAVVSWWTAATFNLSTYWILSVVQFVTAFPPTECDTDHCTWGPWNDDNSAARWKLDVTRNGDGYDYVLAGQATPASPFLPIVSGTAFKGSGAGRGHGAFTMNFDNARTVDGGDDHGVLDVTYDNRTNLEIGALFLGARNDDPANPESQFLDIAYRFGETATGGELQVMFETVDGVTKNLSLLTRWVEAGPGRGDARYHEGDVTYAQSQCWEGAPAGLIDAWKTSFEQVTVNGTALDPSGDLATCGAFSTPKYSDLVLP